jgi:alanine-synthesizing transaminase
VRAEICENYRSRRNVLVEGLNKLGWPVALPKATMFVWAQIPEQYRKLGSLEFSKLLLNEAKDRRFAGDRVWRLRGRACAVFAD